MGITLNCILVHNGVYALAFNQQNGLPTHPRGLSQKYRHNQQTMSNKPNQQKEKKKLKVQKKQRSKGISNVSFRKDTYGNQLSSVVSKGLGGTLRMYPSTLKFGQVYGDPFTKEEAKLPVLPILPTKMLRTVSSGNGTISSAGYFMITVRPVTSAINDFPSVFFSNQAASPPFISTTNANIGTANAKSPYKLADFTYGAEAALSLRIVSMGIRVKYTGTELNAAGTCYMAQTLPKVSMDNYTPDDIQKMQGYKEYPFRNGKWHPLIRHITQENDKDFLQFDATKVLWVTCENDIPTLENTNYLGMICQATPGQSVSWEVVTHFEVSGANLEQREIGHVDNEGTERIINGFAKKRDKDNSTPDHTMGDSGFTKLIGTIVSGAEKLLPLIPSILTAL